MDRIKSAFVAVQRAAREKQAVNITEAAELLQVSRKRVWGLIRQGKLSPVQNPLDRRERLIPVEQLIRVLPTAARETTEEAGIPAAGENSPREPEDEDGWPVPLSDGIAANPNFQSSEYEEYLANHWTRG